MTDLERLKRLIEHAEDERVYVMMLQGSKFVDIYIPCRVGRLLPVDDGT